MAAIKYKPIAPIGTCKGCGSRFNQVLSRGKARAYCTDACKPPKPEPTEQCGIHECSNIVRACGSEYCEMHYYRIRRNGIGKVSIGHIHYDHCLYCGKASNGNKSCSVRCQSRLVRGTPRARKCGACGKEFFPVNKGRDRKSCSDECERFRSQDWHDRRRIASSRDPANLSIRRAVFERDLWVCQLCGDPTDRSSKWPHPMYPTLDHIVPVSKGGVHEAHNLQCAHARCNQRKGAKTMTETNGARR